MMIEVRMAKVNINPEKTQEMLEQLSRLFHAANRQFGGLGELGGLLGGQLSSKFENCISWKEW